MSTLTTPGFSKLRMTTAAVALLVAGCGGATEGLPNSSVPTEPEAGQTTLTEPTGGAITSEVLPEASGPLPDNSIRIGDQVWMRTLPMTSGQCFLYEDDGTLPTSGTVWGTLDNDEGLRFSARYGQDGGFESEVSNNLDMYWGSGQRFGEEELTIELDFDALMVTGTGIFKSLTTGQRAYGSFTFTCDPIDQ
jgi:hypothetical protein